MKLRLAAFSFGYKLPRTHLRVVQKAGPIIDACDVALIVLRSEIEMFGERVPPHNVIFYPAG
jgi:hypothetical protein